MNPPANSSDPIQPAGIADLAIALPPSPSPLVLVDGRFLGALLAVERESASLTVIDAPTAQLAANLKIRLTTAAKKLEEARTAAKLPFLEAGRMIDAAAKAPADRIGAARRTIDYKLTEWAETERKRVAAIEAARVAELKRLEAEQKAEQDRQTKAAEELAARMKAAAPAAPTEDFDMEPPPAAEAPKTDLEKRIDAVKFAPAAVAAKPAGVTFRTVLKHRVTDISKLPDCFVTKTPNDAAIRATFCQGWKDGTALPVVDGVEFIVEKTPVSTGRAW